MPSRCPQARHWAGGECYPPNEAFDVLQEEIDGLLTGGTNAQQIIEMLNLAEVPVLLMLNGRQGDRRSTLNEVGGDKSEWGQN